ncbi:MAG: hypothetical protein AAFX02_05275 [Pseudomonadota bacterium]
MRTDFLTPKGPDEEAENRSAVSKLAWFIGIAAMSGIVVIAVAYALRGALFL